MATDGRTRTKGGTKGESDKAAWRGGQGRGDDKNLGVVQVYNRVLTRVRWMSLGVLGGVPAYANNAAAVSGSVSALRKNHAQE